MLEFILWLLGYFIIGAAFTGILLRNSSYLNEGLLVISMILVWPVFAVMMIPVWIFGLLIQIARVVGKNIGGKR